MSDAKDAPKFRDDLIAHEAKLEAAGTFDPATAAFTLPADFYYTNAPEGVTEAGDRASSAYRDLNLNALTHVTGKKAVQHFAKMQETGQTGTVTVTGTMQAHKDMSLEVAWGRNGTSRNPSTGEVTNYHGALQVRKINERSARTASEGAGIRADIRAMAVSYGLKD